MPVDEAEWRSHSELDASRAQQGRLTQLFTRYYYRGVPKPVLWPIVGPTGNSITRVFPMQDALETERDDHHHHRGLFFTHVITTEKGRSLNLTRTRCSGPKRPRIRSHLMKVQV